MAIWGEIKKAINSNLEKPLNVLIGEKTEEIKSNIETTLKNMNAEIEYSDTNLMATLLDYEISKVGYNGQYLYNKLAQYKVPYDGIYVIKVNAKNTTSNYSTDICFSSYKNTEVNYLSQFFEYMSLSVGSYGNISNGNKFTTLGSLSFSGGTYKVISKIMYLEKGDILLITGTAYQGNVVCNSIKVYGELVM